MAVKDFDWLGSKFGTATENLRREAGSDVDKILLSWVRQRIKVGQEELESDDRNGTGALSASLGSDITSTNEETIVKVLAEDYWDFINSGVNGVQNNFGAPYSFKTLGVGTEMKQAFTEFIQVRGIVPREPNMSYESLAYVLARATKVKGIRATPFMDEAFSNESIKELAERLGKTVKRIFE